MRLRKRITRAVDQALLVRDRVELKAMDALLSTMEAPRRGRRRRRHARPQRKAKR
jgi:hypothetical protein